MTTALEGLRVLQIGAGEATAIAGMVLAENGAEVVIVEPPEGSSDRNRPGHVVWNRGKKSAVLDLDDADGRRQLASLARAVDGAIVALRPGRAEQLGADEATLRAANPALVYVEIGGFGPDGPLAQLPGYQGVVAAASGRFESTNGYRSGPNLRAGADRGIRRGDALGAGPARGAVRAPAHRPRTARLHEPAAHAVDLRHDERIRQPLRPRPRTTVTCSV